MPVWVIANWVRFLTVVCFVTLSLIPKRDRHVAALLAMTDKTHNVCGFVWRSFNLRIVFSPRRQRIPTFLLIHECCSRILRCSCGECVGDVRSTGLLTYKSKEVSYVYK